MKTAAQILRSKPDQTVHTMGPTASVYEAVRLMADKNIGALVVVVVLLTFVPVGYFFTTSWTIFL